MVHTGLMIIMHWCCNHVQESSSEKGYCLHGSYFVCSIYIYIYIRGEFNKFPDFFVQAFKIVVNSWKFTVLLLYILWDDWPIFMISALNKQLQQHLENTLLKPDCHSWWISEIQSGREGTLEERYARKLCFKLGKNPTETYGMLQTTFGPSCMSRALVFERDKGFKEGRESVRDDKRCGRSEEVNTPDFIGQRVGLRLLCWDCSLWLLVIP